MSFTDNRYIVKSPYEYGTLNSSSVGNAHFVRVCSIVSNTTVTLKNFDGDTLGSVLIGNAGDSIVIEKDVLETLTTNQNVYATGEGDGVLPPANDPESIVVDSSTTLQSWYDASNGTEFVPSNPADGATFTQWTDKSNFSHNANPHGGATTRPTFQTNELNSLSVVRFDGVNDGLSINPYSELVNAGAVTVFVVSKLTSSVSDPQIFGTTDGKFSMNYDTINNVWRFNAPTGMAGMFVGPATGANDNAWHIHTVAFDGSQGTNATKFRYRRDKTAITLTFPSTVASTIGSSSQFDIGFNSAGPGNFMEGDIAELLVFDKALTNTEITNIENYLSTKWGL